MTRRPSAFQARQGERTGTGWVRWDPGARSSGREGGDGRRVLVERLWPRGVTKARLRLDEWAKDLAPSPALRRWFGHDPERWPEFRRRYLAELRARPAAWQPLLAAARRGRVTLIYAA